MTRRVSSFASTITLFVAFLAVFASASPANIARDVSATVNKGEATYYEVGLGACGKTNKNSDYIVALSPADFNNKKACGKKVKVTNTKNGKSTTVTVEDECPGCTAKGAQTHVDLSEAAFKAISADGTLNAGVLQITWEFV